MEPLTPSKDTFLRAVSRGAILPLFAEIVKPGLTPLDALEAVGTGGHPVLLESARVHERIGRYSFVTADPYLLFRSRGDVIELSLPATPKGKYGRRATMSRKPLLKLRELTANYRTERIAGLPPFTGGAVGFFSYDFVRQFERLPRKAVFDPDLRSEEHTSELQSTLTL